MISSVFILHRHALPTGPPELDGIPGACSSRAQMLPAVRCLLCAICPPAETHRHINHRCAARVLRDVGKTSSPCIADWISLHMLIRHTLSHGCVTHAGRLSADEDDSLSMKYTPEWMLLGVSTCCFKSASASVQRMGKLGDLQCKLSL